MVNAEKLRRTTRPKRLHSWSMTREKEVGVGARLLELEHALRTVLDRHQASATILAEPMNKKGKPPSRGILAERMGEAARVLWELSKENVVILAGQPGRLRADAREAMRLSAEIGALRWDLVLSVRQVAGGEAAKKYGITGAAAGTNDVQQDGLIGLYWAACRWDPSRGLRFSTYACWWVKAEVQRCESEMQHCVTIGRRGHEARLLSLKTIRRAEGRGATHAEGLKEAAELTGYTVDGVRALVATHQAYSLDDPLPIGGGRGGGTPSLRRDLLAGSDVDPLVDLYAERRTERIAQLTEKLDGDERLERIVRLRFGLDGSDPQTLEQISKQFNLTKERIRQLVMKALRLMRGGDTTRKERTRMTTTTRSDVPLTDRIVAALVSGDASTRELSKRLLGSLARRDTNAIRAACHRMSQAGDGRVVKLGNGRTTRWQRAAPEPESEPKPQASIPGRLWIGKELWTPQPNTNAGDLWVWKCVVHDEGRPVISRFRRDSYATMADLRNQYERGDIVSAIEGKEHGGMTPPAVRTPVPKPALVSDSEADIDLPPEALLVIKRLENTGLFGTTRADVARTLLLQRIRQLVREGW